MSYTVMPFRPDQHREALARLWAENMSDSRIAAAIPERMRWLYDRGPDGPPTTVLCLEAETGAVVGCGTFIQRPTWVDGQRRRAGVLCDFAVQRAHRAGGAALAIQRALLAEARSAGLELLYGYPNEKSHALVKRVGYQVVGRTSTWVKPLHAAYKLSAGPSRGWAARLLAVPLDLGLAWLDRVRCWRVGVASRGELLEGPDERFERLWERARGCHRVVGEKSRAYLDWRYGQFVTADHQFFGLRRHDGQGLVGYAVVKLNQGKATVSDLFTEWPGQEVEPLLLALSTQLRGQRIDSISLSYLGSPALGAILRRAGFLRRPGSRSLVLHPGGLDDLLRTKLFDPGSWLMLDGELDI